MPSTRRGRTQRRPRATSPAPTLSGATESPSRGEKKDVAQIVTDLILDQLEKGVVPWRQPWEGAHAEPMNYVSRRPYRGLNPFLLWITSHAYGYTSPYWLTFRQIAGLGGRLLPDQHATMIVFWKFMTKGKGKDGGKKPKGQARTPAKGQHPGEEEKKVVLLRYYRVFNLQQTTLPEPSVEARQEAPPIEAAEQLVAGYPAPPEIMYRPGNQASYNVATDTVTMPERRQFHSVERLYSTLFHELGHSTRHEARLNRPKDCIRWGDEGYAKEELVAEMAAAILCAHAGITNTVEDSASYIETWLRALRNDKRLVVTAAGAAQKAVDHIRGVPPYQAEEVDD